MTIKHNHTPKYKQHTDQVKSFERLPEPDNGHQASKYGNKINEQSRPIGADERYAMIPTEKGNDGWKRGKVKHTYHNIRIQLKSRTVTQLP